MAENIRFETIVYGELGKVMANTRVALWYWQRAGVEVEGDALP